MTILPAFPQHPWIDNNAFSIPAFVLSCCALSLWGALAGVGAESKAMRMDWYSSQTTGLLLRARFKPNVNQPLKSVCSSLLNELPHQTVVRGLLNHWLAWSQTRLHSLQMSNVLPSDGWFKGKKKKKIHSRLNFTYSFVVRGEKWTETLNHAGLGW